MTAVQSTPWFAAPRSYALGTYVELVVTEGDALPAAQRLLATELDELDRACSRFRSDSELSAANARAGEPVAAGERLRDSVRAALVAAEATDGLVDPTLGCHLVEVGYDRDFASLPADGPVVQPVTIPDEDAPWNRVRVDDDRGTVTVPAGCALDLGATAKARGADRAAARISAELATGALVSLGGDVAAAGAAPADGWPVQVSVSSRQARDTDETVMLTGGGLATSSPAARRWRRGGQLQHHILDPRTGRPVQSTWEAVSVVAPTCVDANTAATAAVVLGQHALPWLRGTAYPSRLVAGDGTVHRLNGWPEPGVWSR